MHSSHCFVTFNVQCAVLALCMGRLNRDISSYKSTYKIQYTQYRIVYTIAKGNRKI